MCNLAQILASFSPLGRVTTSSFVIHLKAESAITYATIAAKIAPIVANLLPSNKKSNPIWVKYAANADTLEAAKGFMIVTNKLGTTREYFIMQNKSATAIYK